jgi:hypothetical protein
MVPTAAHHVWELQAVSEHSGIQTLRWDKRVFSDNGTNLVIFDTKLQIKTDKGKVDAYTFESSGKRKFKILYGTPGFIEETLTPDALALGEAYPNPFSEFTVLPLRLSPAKENYQVTLTYTISVVRKYVPWYMEVQTRIL